MDICNVTIKKEPGIQEGSNIMRTDAEIVLTDIKKETTENADRLADENGIL